MKIINKGFSLIELMIALAIVGILVSVVFPGYRQYVIESRRSEGIAMLLQVMQQQERYYTEQLTYVTDLTQLGYTLLYPLSENENYIITANACPASAINRCVLLTAAPQGGQTADGDLTLNSQGVRTPATFWQ